MRFLYRKVKKITTHIITTFNWLVIFHWILIGPAENSTSSDVAIVYLHKGINWCYVVIPVKKSRGMEKLNIDDKCWVVFKDIEFGNHLKISLAKIISEVFGDMWDKFR